MSSSERQRLSGNNEQERETRESEVRQLIHDLVGRNVEYLSDPKNRLEFIRDQDAESVFRIAQYANAKLRGEKPREVRRSNEEGSYLPRLHTPAAQDKRPAFDRGYDAIREYLESTEDSSEEQLQKAALGTEALLIRTHLFNDANGRTSRFIAKFIENGAADVDALVEEAVSSNARRTVFSRGVATKEALLADADNDEILFDDDERDELRVRAETAPNDIEGMYLTIKGLLASEDQRQFALRHRKNSAA